MRFPHAASFASLLLLASAAHAASTPDTSRALKTLMDEGHASADSHGKGSGHGSGMGTQVTVVKGDTLAKILSRYPELMPPSKAKVFQAVVALNPHAFIGGNPNRLIAGVQLQIPEADELTAMAGGRSAQKASAKDHSAQSKPKDGGQMNAGYSPREDPHAGWVRFPSR